MAERPEKPAAPATPAAAATAAAAPAAAPVTAPAPAAGLMSYLPLVVALVLAPVISWAVAEFLLLPRMKTQLAAVVTARADAPAAGHEAAAATESPAEEKPKETAKPTEPKKAEGKKGEVGGTKIAAEGPNSYQLQNVVVNLAGTMGTRYLKTSFLISGKDTLRAAFEERTPQLLDVTLNTLGSLTLADLEEVGSRNLIRARLVTAYNDILGSRVVEQIYFSDFVVQ